MEPGFAILIHIPPKILSNNVIDVLISTDTVNAPSRGGAEAIGGLGIVVKEERWNVHESTSHVQ